MSIRPAELDAAAAFHVRDRHRTVEWGKEGLEPWATFLARGELATIEDDEAWLREHAQEILDGSGEAEASADIAAGRVTRFTTDQEFLASLDD